MKSKFPHHYYTENILYCRLKITYKEVLFCLQIIVYRFNKYKAYITKKKIQIYNDKLKMFIEHKITFMNFTNLIELRVYDVVMLRYWHTLV